MKKKCSQGYNVNNIVGIDQFGRTFDITAGDKAGKQIGMFYFLWLGHPLFSGVYDATKISNEYGQDTKPAISARRANSISGENLFTAIITRAMNM